MNPNQQNNQHQIRSFFLHPQPAQKMTRTNNFQFQQQPKNIYTAPFDSSHLPTETNHSQTSKISEEKEKVSKKVFFVNPKPFKPLSHSLSAFQLKNSSIQPRAKVAQLEEKIAVLRRTVSQNKIINDSKASEMLIRVQKLRQEYEKKEKKLSEIIKSINGNFS